MGNDPLFAPPAVTMLRIWLGLRANAIAESVVALTIRLAVTVVLLFRVTV